MPYLDLPTAPAAAVVVAAAWHADRVPCLVGWDSRG